MLEGNCSNDLNPRLGIVAFGFVHTESHQTAAVGPSGSIPGCILGCFLLVVTFMWKARSASSDTLYGHYSGRSSR